ncbi:hypothetical protein [Hydrocarboniclastica marina]|uniref:Uncharacterized protein n=1 Tax=Hydrocarboniclastica marina TaxID=2259620 RepID=A0A4V1D8S9_9ALTE|nr:hypothetical protein [Hydrocarboniclastica marina]QCF26250.1 hypothetical protein soil367_10075 [Hydrocarboniclastica marina]
MSALFFIRATGIFLIALSFAVVAQDDSSGEDRALTDVDGISVHATEEEPRVLHIVPWQAPSIPARKRDDIGIPEIGDVLTPIEVETFRVHRHYRQTLDILNVDRSGP